MYVTVMVSVVLYDMEWVSLSMETKFCNTVLPNYDVVLSGLPIFDCVDFVNYSKQRAYREG